MRSSGVGRSRHDDSGPVVSLQQWLHLYTLNLRSQRFGQTRYGGARLVHDNAVWLADTL
jgi:hypothetical protein